MSMMKRQGAALKPILQENLDKTNLKISEIRKNQLLGLEMRCGLSEVDSALMHLSIKRADLERQLSHLEGF